jgi:protocatechuate 4,5-dioxygenase alpha subunit
MREEYSGIPGTTVFDGEQSRRGYHLNQFCMSLLNPANRDRFKADEEAYLSEWSLTETRKSAVLRRDYDAMIAEGANIYFLGKIGATDSKLFVQLTASTSAAPALVHRARRCDTVLPVPLKSARSQA